MAKKPTQLKTKRLIITPMSEEQMRQLISDTEDMELKSAYQEMLDGCVKDPEHRLWYGIWTICRKESGKMLGDACFKGPVKNYSVEIGYGIKPEYQNNGFMTEALRALVDWAFSQENVYFVEAETTLENKASQKVLEKLEFQPDGEGEEGPRFVLEKSETPWMSIYMLFGLSIGMSYGNLYDNMGIGISIGTAIGLCLGLALDQSGKKKREQIREERKSEK